MVKYNKYWFKPKRYGYGAYPISWEGWIIILIFFILILGISLYHEKNNFENYIRFIFELVIIGFVLVFISKKKTKGEWMWRWGNN